MFYYWQHHSNRCIEENEEEEEEEEEDYKNTSTHTIVCDSIIHLPTTIQPFSYDYS